MHHGLLIKYVKFDHKNTILLVIIAVNYHLWFKIKSCDVLFEYLQNNINLYLVCYNILNYTCNHHTHTITPRTNKPRTDHSARRRTHTSTPRARTWTHHGHITHTITSASQSHHEHRGYRVQWGTHVWSELTFRIPVLNFRF